MLDVVATHDHQLALTIEIVGVHNAEPLLPCPPAGHSKTVSEHQPIADKNQHNQDYAGAEQKGDGQQPVVRKQIAEGLHPACRLSHGTQTPLTVAWPRGV
jgi:hypothetical protein